MEYVESLLKEAGFSVSQPCRSRPSCFDYAARKDKSLVFLKLQPDIGSLSLNDSHELQAISESFSAMSLLVGSETREKPLEDDTVYTRHGIFAVTPKTFESVLLHNIRPLVQASPGGYYVEIHPKTLKRRRQELGLSVGQLAEIVGISRRTLYGYERGLAKASVGAAYKLIWVLGVPVGRPLNILDRQTTHPRRCIFSTARHVFAKNTFLLRVFKRLARWHITPVKRAPFDFVLNLPEDGTKIIGGVADKKEPELSRRVDEILSISNVVQASPILVTDGQQIEGKPIHCISREEVTRIKSPKDLMASFRQVESDADLSHF